MLRLLLLLFRSVGQFNVGLIGKATVEKGLDLKVRIQPQRNLIHHLQLAGNSESVSLSFAPENEKPRLEESWQREKQSYLKIFKRNTQHENVKIDTIRIAE